MRSSSYSPFNVLIFPAEVTDLLKSYFPPVGWGATATVLLMFNLPAVGWGRAVTVLLRF